jgi:regulator of RNase E activity RraA
VSVFSNPERPQRKAIQITPERHTLIIDCRGDTRAVFAGQIHVARPMKRGLAGLMGDSASATRDRSEMTISGLSDGPSAPPNLPKHHAVESNRPIGCGGVAV